MWPSYNRTLILFQHPEVHKPPGGVIDANKQAVIAVEIMQQ